MNQTGGEAMTSAGLVFVLRQSLSAFDNDVLNLVAFGELRGLLLMANLPQTDFTHEDAWVIDDIIRRK